MFIVESLYLVQKISNKFAYKPVGIPRIPGNTNILQVKAV